MRHCIAFPAVFGLGLIFADLLPFGGVEPSSQKNQPQISTDADHSPKLPSMFGVLQNSAHASTLLETSQSDARARATQLRVDGDFLKRDSRRPFMNLPQEADCDPREHILVINSEGEGGLWRGHINREFTKAGLAGKFEFWPAEAPDFYEGQAKDGQSGSSPWQLQTLSHIHIYKKLLYMQWACATIFEDNVTLVDDFLSRLTSITVTESIPPFDVICWGWRSSGSKHAVSDGKPELASGQPGPCLFAYTVSLQGALLLLQSMPGRLADEDGNGTAWKQNIRPRIHRSPELMPGTYWHVVPRMAFQG